MASFDRQSPSERRVDDLGRDVFARAVSEAAEIATQNVAQVHRRRLVMHSFFAALVASAAIGIALAVVFHSQSVRNSKANALYDCGLITRLSVPLAQFVHTDAHLRDAQQHLSVQGKINTAFGKLLGKPTLATAERESQLYQKDTVHFWETWVVPHLNAVAGQDCSSHIH